MSMTDRNIRATNRVTWCLTIGAYADDERCDTADHDHYDVAVDKDGNVLYRLDPVGTTYTTPDGWTIRIAKYEDDPFVDPPIEDRLRPQYDCWTPGGGATNLVDYRVLHDLWIGAMLRPGVVRIVHVVPEGGRPAPGALYMRPNGEAWRLTSYGMDWDWDPERLVEAKIVVPKWSVHLPGGASTNGETLPEDARLVWHP